MVKAGARSQITTEMFCCNPSLDASTPPYNLPSSSRVHACISVCFEGVCACLL